MGDGYERKGEELTGSGWPSEETGVRLVSRWEREVTIVGILLRKETIRDSQ